MSRLRAFVAVELPPAVREALAQVQQGLQPGGGSAVRWVKAEGIHLTLKFLGDVEAGQVPAIVRALEAACTPVAPFSLGLSSAGAFPNLRSPRVVWVGLSGELDALARLQQQVEMALHALRFPREGRAFSPHLTLGRVREAAPPAQRRELGQRLTSVAVPPVPAFAVDGVNLMQSQLTPQGAIYSCLHSIPLQAPCEPVV